MRIRHGDILLTKVDKMPKGINVQHDGQHVLAIGEVTGHAHRVTVKNKDDLSVTLADGVKFVSLSVATPLTHEEHKQVEIPAGIYRMTFEREYDYAQESINDVQD